MEKVNRPPSHISGLGRYLLHRVRPGRLEDRPAPRDRGATLEYEALRAGEARIERFLRVTGGDRIELLGADRMLPPTFPAVWETAGMLDLLRMGGFPLPLRGLIQVGGERIFLRPLEAASRIDLRLKLGRCERARTGATVFVEARIFNAVGQLCGQNEMQLLLRGVEAGGRARGEQAERTSPPSSESGWRTLRGWSLAGGLGRRYAAVSGDFNPVHLFRATARPLGFERPILHGCCIEAMVVHALIESVLDGDPAALRRIEISFRAPLSLPGEAYLQILDRAGGGWFRVGGAEGTRPYAIGEWTGGKVKSQG